MLPPHVEEYSVDCCVPKLKSRIESKDDGEDNDRTPHYQASTIKNTTLGTDMDHEVEVIGRCDEVIGVPNTATILQRE